MMSRARRLKVQLGKTLCLLDASTRLPPKARRLRHLPAASCYPQTPEAPERQLRAICAASLRPQLRKSPSGPSKGVKKKCSVKTPSHALGLRVVHAASLRCHDLTTRRARKGPATTNPTQGDAAQQAPRLGAAISAPACHGPMTRKCGA